jgi:hypothetical protein
VLLPARRKFESLKAEKWYEEGGPDMTRDKRDCGKMTGWRNSITVDVGYSIAKKSYTCFETSAYLCLFVLENIPLARLTTRDLERRITLDTHLLLRSHPGLDRSHERRMCRFKRKREDISVIISYRSNLLEG